MNDPARPKPNLRILGEDVPEGGPAEAPQDPADGWPHYDVRPQFDAEVLPLLKALRDKLIELRIPSVLVCLPHVNKETGQIASSGFFNSFGSEERPAPIPLHRLAQEFLTGDIDTNTGLEVPDDRAEGTVNP